MNPYEQFQNDELEQDALDEFRTRCLLARESNKRFCEENEVKHFGAFRMTPQEEKFKILFNEGTQLVKDMDYLTVCAHIEKLEDTAHTAKVHASAASVRKKALEGNRKNVGFTRSVNIDPTSSDAINQIEKRTQRISKQDKMLAGMKALGIDDDYAAKLMSAGTIKAHLDSKGNGAIKPIEPFKNTPEQQAAIDAAKIAEALEEISKSIEAPKPFKNPFAKG